jgi:DNA-directed RNA polymerase specialized sigma24 family protein
VDADEPSNDAIDQLPMLYANALRLWASGTPHNEIAERIGVHPEAIDTVLRLAEDKLRGLLQAGPASRGTTGNPLDSPSSQPRSRNLGKPN